MAATSHIDIFWLVCMYDEMRTIRIINEHNREECKKENQKMDDSSRNEVIYLYVE